jgi:hypothetical protein
MLVQLEAGDVKAEFGPQHLKKLRMWSVDSASALAAGLMPLPRGSASVVIPWSSRAGILKL